MRERICLFCLIFLCACGQKEKDKGIRQMIASQAKQEVAFAAVDYSVVNGVVNLSGTCATEEEKKKVEAAVKETAGVKDVQNNIAVAPVVLTGNHLLKRDVDSVLMEYPSVEATVKDSFVYLQGQIDKASADKMRSALTNLKVRMVNQLVISNE